MEADDVMVAVSRLKQHPLSGRQRQDLSADRSGDRAQRPPLARMEQPPVVVEHHDGTGNEARPKVLKGRALWCGDVHVDRQVGNPGDVDGGERLGHGAPNQVCTGIGSEIRLSQFVTLLVVCNVFRIGLLTLRRVSLLDRDPGERVEEPHVAVQSVEVDVAADGQRVDTGVHPALDIVTIEPCCMLSCPAEDVHPPLDVNIVVRSPGAANVVTGVHAGPVCGHKAAVVQERDGLAPHRQCIGVVGRIGQPPNVHLERVVELVGVLPGTSDLRVQFLSSLPSGGFTRDESLQVRLIHTIHCGGSER